MARQISKSSTSSTSQVNQKNKQTQKNNSWSNTSQKSSGKSTSYKDLSKLSPETLALQNEVYSQTGYTPSQSVEKAEAQKAAAEQALSNYGKYNSHYQPALEKTLNDILNRKSFNYDFNADALYQNYKDSYEQQGREAAQNAAAAASALTGGYGNSYATSAANQANEAYMTELNNKIPELYQLALDRYNMETQNLYDRYGAIGEQEDRAYGQWSDERDNLVADRDYYGNAYDSERNFDVTTQQNKYENMMKLLGYRTELEARDVTKEKSNNTVKEKSGSKSKNVENTSTTSRDSQSTVSNAKGAKSTTVNNLSGTKTSESEVQEALKTFKDKMAARYDSETGTYDEKAINDAWNYLDELVRSGDIEEDDARWIGNITGAPVPKA
ncbi:MAG: hypothetical protein E7267_03905 [Lachnospiraceae bacterium]|nr:hypothetical protein [Lachnospiraceae bacterium]